MGGRYDISNCQHNSYYPMDASNFSHKFYIKLDRDLILKFSLLGEFRHYCSLNSNLTALTNARISRNK